jgi:hypothetical protein
MIGRFVFSAVKLLEQMNRSRVISLALVWSLVLVDFWLFARFTVDDAFITWRYGQNLIEHGVWNYNPTGFDPTQSYTNPIYALLSIIPAALGINVVLFFKLLSLCIFGYFTYWFLKRRPDSAVFLGLFYAVPATAIHLFSGLETFLFVALVCQLFIYVKEHSYRATLVVASLLFVTRPESWTLVFTLPLVLAWSRKRFHWKRFWKSSAVLGSVLGGYFAVHFVLFGELLPNTFFVKSGVVIFETYKLFNLLLVFLLFIPVLSLHFRRVTLLALLLLLPMVANYTVSNLAMDYASRYAFHLYAPAALLLIYSFGSSENRLKLEQSFKSLPFGRHLPKLGVTVVALGFAYTTFYFNLNTVVNYYPRLLDAHGRLGQLISVSNIDATAIGDAGLAPYRGGKKNLDLYKLGSHLAAKNGITRQLLETYQVDLAATAIKSHSEKEIAPLLEEIGLKPTCNLVLRPKYHLRIWSRFETQSLRRICSLSNSRNNLEEDTYFVMNVKTAPWLYWR